MAGSVNVLDTASGITADQISEPSPGGAHKKANFWVDLTAITRTTGSLVISLYWSPDGTIAGGQLVAVSAALTAIGLTQLPIEAEFVSAEDSIPAPNLVEWDLIGDATAVSGRLYAMYA